MKNATKASYMFMRLRRIRRTQQTGIDVGADNKRREPRYGQCRKQNRK